MLRAVQGALNRFEGPTAWHGDYSRRPEPVNLTNPSLNVRGRSSRSPARISADHPYADEVEDLGSSSRLRRTHATSAQHLI
jgi:hypothetical protein